MREFFGGWRRKAGCVALVMACGLTGMWIRSCLVEDRVIWFGNDLAYLFNSEDGSASWSAYSGLSHSAPAKRLWWGAAPITGVPYHGWWQAKDECETLHEFQFLGFYFGSAFKPNLERADYWLIPYWSLVLPLTLLSAYLILWKPRKRRGSDHA